MNYHQYYPVDVVNGIGTRCSLFVSGCPHKCKGCYNKSTWRSDSGHLFDQAMEDRIIADLQDTKIKRKGISLSGGDPLNFGNLATLIKLVQRIKYECSGKDIWLWTGFLMADLTKEQRILANLVDVIIDGKYEQDLHDAKLKWRGSSNQVIYRRSAKGFEVAEDLMI